MIDSKLIKLLTTHQITVAAAESLSGGELLSRLISVPGASNVIAGGMVCYSNQSKIDVLGVAAETIATYGAVSEQTAAQMAAAVRSRFGTTIGLATTGVAGPDSQEGKAVGTVYVALTDGEISWVVSHQFKGERNLVRAQSAAAAVELLGKYSGNLPSVPGVSGAQ